MSAKAEVGDEDDGAVVFGGSQQQVEASQCSLRECIQIRRSIRVFKPDPVPQRIIQDCLQLARWAPSNSNIQPWRLHLASGAARDRIIKALLNEAEEHGPNIPPLPDHLRHFRSEFGHLLYGETGYGVPKDDDSGVHAARMRNFEFYGAPVCGVITMDSALTLVDAMTVGMFIQSFWLSLVEKGLGSCLLVSVTGYPDILRKEFGIKEDQHLLSGIAIGWPGDHQVNRMITPREDIDKLLHFSE